MNVTVVIIVTSHHDDCHNHHQHHYNSQHYHGKYKPESLCKLSDQLLDAQVIGEDGIASKAPRPGVNRHAVLPLVLL